MIIYFYTALQKSSLGISILEIDNELEFPLNKRQCVFVLKAPYRATSDSSMHVLMAVQCAGFSHIEVHLQASHIKLRHRTPVISFMF